MSKINQREFSKLLSKFYTFAAKRCRFAENHSIFLDEELFLDEEPIDPHWVHHIAHFAHLANKAMKMRVNHITFVFSHEKIHSIAMSGINIDLKDVKDDEMELISCQFAYLDQIHELEIEKEGKQHQENVQLTLEKINRDLKELPTENNNSKHIKSLLQSPTEEDIAAQRRAAADKRREIELASSIKFMQEEDERIARKEDRLERLKIEKTIQEARERKSREPTEQQIAEFEEDLFKETDSSFLVHSKKDETSFVAKVLYSLVTWTPTTAFGVATYLITAGALFALFGFNGMALFLPISLFCWHTVDTIIYVSDKEDEKQKALTEEYWVPIEEKPKIKTYDELMKEEDAELTRKIEALAEMTE